jgi:hypothetical protein
MSKNPRAEIPSHRTQRHTRKESTEVVKVSVLVTYIARLAKATRKATARSVMQQKDRRQGAKLASAALD